MYLNRIDREGTGNFAGVAATHSITDHIESERRVGCKAVLVMSPFESGVRFCAM
jgi:hypothetical protein